jgi:pimeloyl-ACP methyl ester carboxylesterase
MERGCYTAISANENSVTIEIIWRAGRTRLFGRRTTSSLPPIFAGSHLGQAPAWTPGTDDPIVPVANGHILAKLTPNARLTTIDDGHLFLVTSPCASAKLVSEFLLQSGCGD